MIPMPVDPLTAATAGFREAPNDWMPASQVGPFIFDDPGLVWLEYHGEDHGFHPDDSPYEFIDFITSKGSNYLSIF